LNPNVLSQKLQDQYFSESQASKGLAELMPSHWVHASVTERELVEDSLMFLDSGVSSYFKEDAVTRQFSLARAIEVKHLSSESLKQQLDSVANFYTSHHRIDTRLVQAEEMEGAVMQRLSKVIHQVQTEVKVELGYLQVIFGIQNGK
jgi:hypothetical protein